MKRKKFICIALIFCMMLCLGYSNHIAAQTFAADHSLQREVLQVQKDLNQKVCMPEMIGIQNVLMVQKNLEQKVCVKESPEQLAEAVLIFRDEAEGTDFLLKKLQKQHDKKSQEVYALQYIHRKDGKK